jgi:hypothetical protein
MRDTYVDQYEEDMTVAAADVNEVVEDYIERLGPRPLLWERLDTDEQLEQFLQIRDDPVAWEAIQTAYEPKFGRDWAEVSAALTFDHYDRLLEKRGGATAFMAALFLKRLAQARPIVEKARKIEDLPKAEIVGPLPQIDFADFIDGSYAEAYEPRIATPLLPPSQADAVGMEAGREAQTGAEAYRPQIGGQWPV